MSCPTKARNLGQRGVSGRGRRPMGLNRRQLPRRGPARPGKNDLGRATDGRRTDGQCGGTKIFFSKIMAGAVVGNPEGGASGAGAGWGASGGVGGRKIRCWHFEAHSGLCPGLSTCSTYLWPNDQLWVQWQWCGGDRPGYSRTRYTCSPSGCMMRIQINPHTVQY